MAASDEKPRRTSDLGRVARELPERLLTDHSTAGLRRSVILLALVVLGGMGKLHGMIVAAFGLTVIAAFVGAYFGATWSGITFYLALFLILLVRPQGLFGDRVEDA